MATWWASDVGSHPSCRPLRMTEAPPRAVNPRGRGLPTGRSMTRASRLHRGRSRHSGRIVYRPWRRSVFVTVKGHGGSGQLGSSRRRWNGGSCRGRAGRGRGSAHRRLGQGAVEEQVFDAGVVVEVLEVAQVGDADGDVGVEVGGAVPGDLESVGGGQVGDRGPGGVAAASGDVGLEAVDGAGRRSWARSTRRYSRIRRRRRRRRSGPGPAAVRRGRRRRPAPRTSSPGTSSIMWRPRRTACFRV